MNARLIPVLLFCIALFFVAGTAHADIGPKPQMEFAFEFQIKPVAIISGQQIECPDPECTTAKPLVVAGPQGLFCHNDSCYSMAYGSFAPYHKLSITFADKTRESNVFATGGDFVVIVREDNLLVKPIFRPEKQVFGFVLALPFTLLIELVVAIVYVLATKLPKRTLAWAIVANLISLPIVWFIFPMISQSAIVTTWLAEIFAAVFEAFVLHITNRSKVSPAHAIVLSVLMNAASFAVGFCAGTMF